MGHLLEDTASGPPDEFTEMVRDALLHMYDWAHLQTHPLLAFSVGGESEPIARGRVLRQALLDAIETLAPTPTVESSPRAWRAYRIMELRYIDGREVSDAIGEAHLSRSQYHREHHRALQAVASVLWDSWQVTAIWANTAAPAPAVEANLAKQEVDTLIQRGSIEKIDLGNMLCEVQHLVEPLCWRRGIDLRLEVSNAALPIAGERVAIRQAILALLTHVIDESEPGQIRISLTYRNHEAELSVGGESVAVSPPNPREVDEIRLFAEAVGASLAYPQTLPSIEPRPIRLSFPARRDWVLLVVDNNADFIRLVERYLSGSGWEVLGTAEPDLAQMLIEERRPQAIVLDVLMPGRDGWDILLSLKENADTASIPVVICSVLERPELATSLGAALYLKKPVAQGQLLAALRQFQ
ncbi:MAG: response regulator [Dehalococcoidales bacterium]|nr:response regulator [Dehalococcoidales bacterium]